MPIIKKLIEAVNDFTKPCADETYRIRLEICDSCEYFTNSPQCGICLCHMPTKALLAKSSCPISQHGLTEEQHNRLCPDQPFTPKWGPENPV